MDTAKIFKTGRSQAVRLPKKYRFATSEVEISRENALEAFLALPKCPDFELDRSEAQKVQERELF